MRHNPNSKSSLVESLKDSFLLGKTLDKKRMQPGFTANQAKVRNSELIFDTGEIHNITIGKSGSGKGRSSIIPNSLTNCCSAVILDVKGELYKTTANQRRRMGHSVYCLDPFNQLNLNFARLNPFDLWKVIQHKDVMNFSQSLAQIICEQTSLKEPIWDGSAFHLISALICYICTARSEGEKNLETLVRLLTGDDVVYDLAVILDTQKSKMHEWAYRGISSFLQITDITRSGVLFTAQSYFRVFNSPQILNNLKESTIDLSEFMNGEKPMTIYVVIPPAYIQSHFPLVKVWFYTFLKALTERRKIPRNPTVFYMDEIAQFGHFELLENIMTIGRGYGIKVWLFLQGLQQLQSNYPKGWRTMLENCGVLQIFGVNNKLTADEISALSGIASEDLLGIMKNEQYLVRQGVAEKAEKLDYLIDEMFAGKFDSNPFYENKKSKDLSHLDFNPNSR